jgi:hypothetical protein
MVDEVQLGLEIGRIYNAEELGKVFGFSPYYLRAAGGMVPAPKKESLLLITHAGKEASFEYGDYWDGEDLIYTGRGQDGDQILEGPNRDVAENRRALWVFERLEKYQRRFLGRGTCTSYIWAVAPDKNGVQRRVLRFCIRVEAVEPSLRSASQLGGANPSRRVRPPHRSPRPFDETAAPTSPAAWLPSVAPEEIAQLNEKAIAGHHALLVELKRWLELNQWTGIEEIPAAVDLWAVRGGERVIFEAKTITSGTELVQTRAALGQLLEYRFFYGTPGDCLCLVTDAPLSDRRLRFLDAMGLLVLWHNGKEFLRCGRGELLRDVHP